MRQFTLKFFFCVAIFAASAMASNAQSRQTYFSSGQQCIEAIKSGTANFYRPTYFKLHKAVSATEEVRGLESDACVLMLTVKGYQWVAQKEGEKMVFKGLNIHRRYDCGNPIKEILYPKTEVIDSPPVQAKSNPPVQAKCPPGTEESETPGICIQKVPGPDVPGPTVYINPCPTDAEFDGTTSWKSRLGGGLLQAGISGGASILLTKARGAEWNDSLRSGAYGVGLQRVQQGINASEDGIRLRIPSLGIDQKISKGKNVDLANGVSVRWDGNRVALFRNLNGQSYRCDGFGLTKGSNMGVWTDGDSVDKQGQKKVTRGSSEPDRPSTTGNPGTPLSVGNNGPVGGTVGTVPVRVRIGNNLIDEAYGNSPVLPVMRNSSNASPATQQGASACKGQLITLGGKQRCVND